MYYTKETIFIPELNRHAKLYVGLPDDYETSNKHYPVLYMHDGHNLFDKNDSYIGVTWGIIESYQNDPTLPQIIIVGLECAQGIERLDEYCAFEFDFKGYKNPFEKELVGGKGDLYLNYLINQLKPRIDENYRTLTDKDHTAMMGSSMGGVISIHAAVQYNHVFSRIASLSGAFYVTLDHILQSIHLADLTNINKIYLDTGTKEAQGEFNELYIRANDEVYQALKKKLSIEQLKYEVIQDAIHNEAEWAKRFPQILNYLFS